MKNCQFDQRGGRKKCSAGEIYRVPYTRRLGSKRIQVPGNCIRSVSQSKTKRSLKDAGEIKKRERVHKRINRMYSRDKPKCPPGTVLRSGFTRKGTNRRSFRRSSGAFVGPSRVKSSITRPVCVKNINRVKKKRLFVLEKDALKKYGYYDINNLTLSQRRRAIKRALADIEPLPLFRRLNALRVLQKNTNPNLSKKFQEDAEWLKNTSAYQNRPTAPRSLSRSGRSRSSRRSRSRTRSNSRGSR